MSKETFEIVIKWKELKYHYSCEDEESILYLYRRIKDAYEEHSAMTQERVTMEVRNGEQWYVIRKDGFEGHYENSEVVNIVINGGYI